MQKRIACGHNQLPCGLRKTNRHRCTEARRHTAETAVRSEGDGARRSLAQGDQGGKRQAMHRRRQYRPDNIGIQLKQRRAREALGAIGAAGTVAGIVLCTGAVVLVVVEYYSGIVMRVCVTGMHARCIRRRCGRHRQRLNYRRTGKRQCQDQGKCDTWQGHVRNFSIVLRGRQTARFTWILPTP
jgi:hypothetical protein